MRHLPLTVRTFLILDLFHATTISPRMMLDCKNITFYIPLYRFRQSSYNHDLYSNIPNLRLMTDSMAWICLQRLLDYKQFRFYRLKYSHLEACIHERCQSDAVQILTEMKLDNIILDFPIDGSFSEETVRKMLHLRITYISSNMFDTQTEFPLKIFTEMPFLQEIHFAKDIAVDLMKMTRISYLYIRIGRIRHFCGVQNLPFTRPNVYEKQNILYHCYGNIYGVGFAFYLVLRKRNNFVEPTKAWQYLK